MKLILGAANFHNSYRSANITTSLTRKDLYLSLNDAENYGVRHIDTAQDYGDSEKVIGQVNAHRFEVSTKIHDIANIDIKETLIRRIEISLKRLKKSSIDCLYFHRVSDVELAQQDLAQFVNAVQHVKNMGLCKRIGVSIYLPAELDKINWDMIDVIQFPCNVIDGRWDQKLDLSFRKKHPKIELLARSVFLNGLLLNPNLFSKKFPRFNHLFADASPLAEHHSATNRLSYCLNGLEKLSYVDGIVVGFQTREQLLSILEANGRAVQINEEIRIIDNQVLDVRQWF